ncbi:V-type ATP synthase alpha chain [Halomonas elongata]|uniref:V-type ATP synthase alpha chain n=1 Tax=Halomonas elongata TaxID=2746 RepID=A0A1B8P265_HALEL|nr:hypothetical protein [Halomonas elongata]OBX36332.1 V-type ATP synthase alpha chain [Halomonas elongata]
MHGGQCGSLTLIGTVSPAGGNFEEPVTQGTLNTVKTFLGLSYDRAYKRFYPAVDPLISWSRYPEQLSGWFRRTMGEHWQADVDRLKALLHEGDEIERMMQVTGEEGISDADFLSQQKATLVDMVYLQQDAFDKVDASTSLNRQKAAMALLIRIVDAPLSFGGKQDIRDVFTRLTDLFRNLNYAEFESDNYWKIRHSIDELLKQYAREASRTAAYPASTP